MLLISDPDDLSTVIQPEIIALLAQRFQQLFEPEPYDPQTHGYFVLIQPGDDTESIVVETGINILGSLFDDSVYGDSDFAPYFECVVDHGTFFELVFIFTDDGFLRIFVIPKADGIDGKILEFCTEFAEPLE